MMMFSLRPRRSSLAPRMAASVSTRVVSWNDAAEMNDCVVRLALVMPRSTGSACAGSHPFALVHPEVLARRHLVQLRLGLLGRRGLGIDVDLALAALDLAELDHPVHLGNGGRILGPASLEQLRDTRQTARDVPSLVRLARDLGDGDALGHLDRRGEEDGLVLALL